MADGGMGLANDITENSQVRLMIYSHDTYGLGNIRRMLAIAEYIVEANKNFHVLMITGSPMMQGFRVSPRIDFVKLPCLSRDRSGAYTVRSLPLDHQNLLAMRARMIRCVIEDYEPDLLLVDKKPSGVEGELDLALQYIESSSRKKPAVALVLRDILDHPVATRNTWIKRGYHQVIDQLYDLILVAGQPEIFDVAEQYQFPESSRRKLRYCGYIKRMEVEESVSPIKTHKKILMLAGGGADGFELMQAYLQGLGGSSLESLQKTLIISGPEMPDTERQELLALAATCQNVEVKEFSGNVQDEINLADLVICMCGCNTICEVLASGKKVIAVPRVVPVQEQYIRAHHFSRRGLLRMVDPNALTPELLMSVIADELMDRPHMNRTDQLDFGGLDRMNHWVKRLVEERLPTNGFSKTYEPLTLGNTA